MMKVLEIISYAIGFIGIAIEIWQSLETRKLKANARKSSDLYKEKCETRCKDLVNVVRNLSLPFAHACKIKDGKQFEDILKRNSTNGDTLKIIIELSNQIHAIAVSKNDLVRFCERLNEEHKAEFNEKVFENILERFWYYADSDKGIVRYSDIKNF